MTGVDPAEEAGTQAFRDTVAGLRRLTDVLLRVDDDDPALDAVAAELDRITARVDQAARASGTGSAPGDGDPVSGHLNALAPPLSTAATTDGTVCATGVLGLPYQGPRGLVHGGVSALILDGVLRTAGTARHGPAVLEELTVRYHRPVPLFEEVAVTCRHTDRDGDDIRAGGEITVNEQIAVSAQAHFRAAPGDPAPRSEPRRL